MGRKSGRLQKAQQHRVATTLRRRHYICRCDDKSRKKFIRRDMKFNKTLPFERPKIYEAKKSIELLLSRPIDRKLPSFSFHLPSNTHNHGWIPNLFLNKCNDTNTRAESSFAGLQQRNELA